MEIFELWTHVLEEIKIKNPEYYNNFYSFDDITFGRIVKTRKNFTEKN